MALSAFQEAQDFFKKLNMGGIVKQAITPGPVRIINQVARTPQVQQFARQATPVVKSYANVIKQAARPVTNYAMSQPLIQLPGIGPKPKVPFSPSVGQYTQGQIQRPLQTAFNKKAKPMDRIISGVQAGLSLTPGGTTYNILSGGAAGLLKSARTKTNYNDVIKQSIAAPTSIGSQGLGIKNPALALGVDIVAGGPKGVLKGISKLSGTIKALKGTDRMLTQDIVDASKAIQRYMDNSFDIKYMTSDGIKDERTIRGVAEFYIDKKFAQKGRLEEVAQELSNRIMIDRRNIPKMGIAKGIMADGGKPKLESDFTGIKATEEVLQKKLSQERNLEVPERPLQAPGSPDIPGSSSGGSITKENLNPQDPFFNVERLNVTPEQRKAIAKVVTDSKSEIEKITGQKLSNTEAINLANKGASILKKVATREETLEWEAKLLRARKLLADQAGQGTVTKEYIDNLVAIKSQATDIARKLQSFTINADPQTITAKEALLEAVLKVNDNTDEILRAAQGVDFNDQKQAVEFYRQFVKPTTSDWVDLLRYNSMLSSPNTHIINLASNLQGAVLLAPIEKLTLGMFDFMGATLTGRQRRYFSGEAGAYLKGFLTAFRPAAKAFGDVMSGKSFIKHPDIRNVPLTTRGPKRILENTLAVPMKFLEGSDQFLQTLARAGEFRGIKYRMSKGVDVVNPELKASLKASERLFRAELKGDQQGHMLNAIDSVTNTLLNLRRSKNPLVSNISKFTLPFVQTPTNIFKQGLEYSPLGLTTLPGASNKLEQFNKVALGTSVGLAVATLASSNRLTWGKPTDPKSKRAFDAAGMQPYSIKIGDKWVNYSKLHPSVAFNFAIVAAVKDSLNQKRISESDSEVILNGLAKSFQFFVDQSYAKQIGDMFSSAKGDPEGLVRYVANYPTQLIPFRALMSWVNRFVDPYERQVDQAGTMLEQQMQYIASQLPGLSQRLPERRDLRGKPIMRQNVGLNAFSPARITTEDPEQKKQFLFNTTAIRAHQELKKLPKDEANQLAKEIKKRNPQMFSNLKQIVADEKLGLTDREAKIRNMGVVGGDRAYAIVGELNKLNTPEEKNEYIKKLRKAKIITPKVLKQLKVLKQRGELK